MRAPRYVLWPAGLAFGLVAEWIARPDLAALDAAAGFALLFGGLLAWSRRPASRAGPIMTLAGLAWFLGTLWQPAVFLHRGPLAHLLLSYPGGRLSSRLERAAVAAAYVYAAVYPVAADDGVTIVFAVCLVTLAARRYATAASGAARRARLAPLAGATAFGLVLVLSSAARLADLGGGRAALAAYDLVVCLIAAGLCADLLRGRWARAAVPGIVVDLGEAETGGPLRDRLAHALGDPTLVVGYRLPESGRYVDETGRPVELPAPDGSQAVTPIEEDGTRIAVLVHDPAALDDPALVSAVAAATRLAVSNAGLQGEVRARVAEVEASRRRIVEAADDQRRRLEQELQDGAERRLARVAELVAGPDRPLDGLPSRVEDARNELRELALGIHPPALSRGGLGAALGELAARCPVPVDVTAPADRFAPAVETAVYFVCAEALANVAKYAEASHVRIRVASSDSRLELEVVDDGVGGADPAGGSGLRGLADRVEALDGRLTVTSIRGQGTRLAAELPLRDVP